MRADALGGDLRLFYLLWLTAVEAEVIKPDEIEPLPGIGPMTGALEAFVRFFGIDADLVAAAAAGHPVGTTADKSLSSDVVRRFVATLPDHEKTALLTRLIERAPHVESKLRAPVRDRSASEPSATRLTLALRAVGEQRARARAIRQARERKESERMAVERKQRAAEEKRARRARLDAIMRRGDDVWREIKSEIERRNASAYDKAAGLLLDLKTIAEERGTTEDFSHRLRAIRERHARKERVIERLTGLG